MEGASELIAELAEAGATVILASSATEDEVDHYIDLLDAAERIAGATSSADAEQTKPDPELVRAALEKYGSGGPALMVGDSTWDVIAAKAAGIPTLALLTGGFSESELREAGAVEVAESIATLREGGVAAILDLARARVPGVMTEFGYTLMCEQSPPTPSSATSSAPRPRASTSPRSLTTSSPGWSSRATRPTPGRCSAPRPR